MGLRRSAREISVFSMSALDLFASALGAFIIISVITLPYYLKTDAQLMQESREMQAQIAEQQEQIENTARELEEAKKEIEDAIEFALLGLASRESSFVLVIDLSGSMDGTGAAAAMVDTVNRIVQPMTEKHQVALLGFQGDASSPTLKWRPGVRQLVAMSSTNKGVLSNAVQRFTGEFGGGTPTLAALREALASPARAIVLLSDGNPSDAPPDQIVELIRRANTSDKEIHCVGIGGYTQKPELMRFLGTLATANRGGVTAVAI